MIISTGNRIFIVKYVIIELEMRKEVSHL